MSHVFLLGSKFVTQLAVCLLMQCCWGATFLVVNIASGMTHAPLRASDPVHVGMYCSDGTTLFGRAQGFVCRKVEFEVSGWYARAHTSILYARWYARAVCASGMRGQLGFLNPIVSDRNCF